MIWAFRAAGMALVATVLAMAAIVVMAAGGDETRPVTNATVAIHFSKFETRRLTVPAGVPITLVLENEDPIEHEWMVGDDAMHDRHRTGTEPYHDEIPTEVSLRPFETRTTVVQFDTPGDYEFVCHLPGHEQYGMKGVIRVVSQ